MPVDGSATAKKKSLGRNGLQLGHEPDRLEWTSFRVVL